MERGKSNEDILKIAPTRISIQEGRKMEQDKEGDGPADDDTVENKESRLLMKIVQDRALRSNTKDGFDGEVDGNVRVGTSGPRGEEEETMMLMKIVEERARRNNCDDANQQQVEDEAATGTLINTELHGDVAKGRKVSGVVPPLTQQSSNHILQCIKQSPDEDTSPPITALSRNLPSRPPTELGAIRVSGMSEDSNNDASLQFGEESIPSTRLAVASEIRASERPEFLDVAEEFDPIEHGKSVQQEREKTRMYLGLGGVVGVAALVLLLVFLVGPDENSMIDTLSASPSASPTISTEAFLYSLLPEATVRTIMTDPDSPQASAYQWMLNDPNLPAYASNRLIQRYSLATLYLATSGDDWYTNTDWLDHSIHECSWVSKEIGVLVDFDFSDDPEIEYLSHQPFPCQGEDYTHLWLFDNNLQGEIPNELYLLTDLKSIVIASSPMLEGTIPTQIQSLSSLEYLLLANCALAGTLPSQLGLLSSLYSLILFYNRFEGRIPSQLGLLSSYDRPFPLGILLDSNQFTGTIPTELATLQDMERLYLSTNQLVGPIPTQFGLANGLTDLLLDDNQLSGSIPSELMSLPNLSYLYLYVNQLIGEVPSQVGNLENILHLALEYNLLTSPLPSQLGSSPTITNIWIHGNLLSGSLPRQLGQLQLLNDLELQSNFLTNSIPSQLGLLLNMTVLLLSQNRITGTLPSELDWLVGGGSLTVLDLQDNLLSGTISNQLCAALDFDTCSSCDLVFDCSEALCGCGNCPCA